MKTLLIVEDVAELRLMLKEYFEQSGSDVSVSEASNVWEARLAIQTRKPDLILLDEVLPGESALDFLTELKSEAIPTMLMTGVSNPNSSVPEGALGRLVKPEPDSKDRAWKSFVAKALEKFE